MQQNSKENYWLVTEDDIKTFRELLKNPRMYDDPYLPQKYRIMYENSVKTQALLAWNISQYYPDSDEAIKAICDKYENGRIIYWSIQKNRKDFGILGTSLDRMLQSTTSIMSALSDGELKQIVQQYMWNMCEQISF